MTSKPNTSFKMKLNKKLTASKSSTSIVSSSLYSGVASAQRAIQNPGLLLGIERSPMKSSDAQTPALNPDTSPSVEYHPWNVKYLQIHMRENIKKSMTKDTYIHVDQLPHNAKESIVTEQECQLELISAENIQTRQVIIHGEEKPPTQNIIRYLRSNNTISSEGILPTINSKRPSTSHIGTNTSFPMIGINQSSAPRATIVSRNVFLSEIKLKHNNKINRRRSASRRIAMETIHETITPLTVYG